MNESWHRQNPLAPRATLEQRVAWHREHARACGCRKPPAAVAAVLAHELPPGAEPPLEKS